MKPKVFNECNVVFARDQDQYFDLPAHVTPRGDVTICWQLSLRERVKLALTGLLFHKILTFKRPLQPIRLTVDKPFVCM